MSTTLGLTITQQGMAESRSSSPCTNSAGAVVGRVSRVLFLILLLSPPPFVWNRSMCTGLLSQVTLKNKHNLPPCWLSLAWRSSAPPGRIRKGVSSLTRSTLNHSVNHWTSAGGPDIPWAVSLIAVECVVCGLWSQTRQPTWNGNFFQLGQMSFQVILIHFL